MDFGEKVCVVTGASSGIGRRTALDLSAEGTKVCVAARRADRLTALVDEMGDEARGHSYHVTDVSKKADVRALAAHVKKVHGRCDILVNNAGFSGEPAFDGPESVRALEAIMRTNFLGAVYCTAELLPMLFESTPAHIVNVASMAGRLGLGGASAYSASKFALVGWSEALHFELAPRGVFVSIVEPGFIPTEGFPQKPFVRHPVFRYALGSEADVSAAIRQAMARRKLERVVPRWYYLLQVPRVMTPRLYRAVLHRMSGAGLARRGTKKQSR